MKLAGTCFRALQLCRVVAAEKPDIGISHGSRSQLLSCALLGIPSITICDYEFVSLSLVRLLRGIGRNWLMAPQVIPDHDLGVNGKPLLKYPGIKEDVYVPRFKPDPAITSQLGLQDGKLVVTMRPPASEAHYRNPESEKLFGAVMSFLVAHPDSQIVVIPRNDKQKDQLREQWSEALATKKIIIPDRAVDGLNLIWHSDLVVSGGGTMNREAAALGVPVYSVFRGRMGAIDRYLAQSNRLILLDSVADIEKKLLLMPRTKTAAPNPVNQKALPKIVENIISVLDPAVNQ
jgi:predicted glycosyltransferase